MATQKILVRDLGRLGYQQSWDMQEELLKENVELKKSMASQLRSEPEFVSTDVSQTYLSNVLPDTRHYLLYVEHPPVLTLGKSGKEENVLLSDDLLQQKGIEYIKTNRGGDITFHGPGQIVGYPILDLEKYYTDIGKYLRNIEEVIILTLAEYGLHADRSPGETGVWLDPYEKGRERKICAIGVRCSRWVTMHGFAFNVNTDLSYFDYIIPCGIQNKQVTSLQKELGKEVDIEEVKNKITKNFAKVFESEMIIDSI